MANLNSEIDKRRTFAIISHPDAGKTTLTEKLLLFGGAIHVAGAVKSNKIKKSATSDWMEIEKQRGISVATSVMGFNYGDYKINILDTPGYFDFEGEVRQAVRVADSALMVVSGKSSAYSRLSKMRCTRRLKRDAKEPEYEAIAMRMLGLSPSIYAGSRVVAPTDFPCCGGIVIISRLIFPRAKASSTR